MNLFESFGKSVQNMSTQELKSKGLEGICTECSGKGRVNASIFNDGRVCAKCHGKGFLKHDAGEQENPPAQGEEVLH